MKLLFWLVRNKANKKNESPVYCRITINGQRAELSTGIYVKAAGFDTKRGRIKGTGELERKQNCQLDKVGVSLQNIYYNQIFSGNPAPTAPEVKDFYLAKRKIIVLFADLLREYTSEYYRMYQKEDKWNRHNRFIAVIEKALAGIGEANLKLTACNRYVLDNLAHQVVDKLEYSVSYTKKIFAFIKSALLFAYNNRYTDNYPAYEYKVPYRAKTEVVYLEEWELNKITGHVFMPSLQRCADLFTVQCYTGLAYVDLSRLNASHISKDESGLKWITITRQKVETAECIIPVIGRVWDILMKYGFELPIISNQKYNAALKKIAREVGIQKNLTTHVGRKTYGTLLLNKDVPIETVSNLLGHSSIKITQQHYAKVLHKKVAKDVVLFI